MPIAIRLILGLLPLLGLGRVHADTPGRVLNLSLFMFLAGIRSRLPMVIRETRSLSLFECSVMSRQDRSDFSELLQCFYSGDPNARNQILARAQERLRWHASRLLSRFASLRRWENTDSILQETLLRMDRALHELVLDTNVAFFALAARHMRYVLIDLTRHYRRIIEHHQSPAPEAEVEPRSHEPSTAPFGQPDDLLLWEEFHQQAEQLNENERQIFDLIWYHGLPLSEVAVVLGCSARTARRYWQAARIHLVEALDGKLPPT